MDLQKDILDWFWSLDLKKHIEETGYRFSEADLLAIAYKLAPSYGQQLRMLNLVAENCPTVSDHARKIIAYREKCLAHFVEHDPYQVYELKIQEDPSDPRDCEERYLCESYEAALDMIDGFYLEYDFVSEKPTVRYTVTKRCILRKGGSFREDHCGEAILGAGKVLISVDNIPGETEHGPCPADCKDCGQLCIHDLEVDFPNFLPPRSPVQYRLPNGCIRYGIDLSYTFKSPLTEFYIIPLESEMLTSREYDDRWGCHWHEHIPVCNVRPVSPEALPEKLRENYLAFLPWCISTFGE